MSAKCKRRRLAMGTEVELPALEEVAKVVDGKMHCRNSSSKVPRSCVGVLAGTAQSHRGLATRLPSAVKISGSRMETTGTGGGRGILSPHGASIVLALWCFVARPKRIARVATRVTAGCLQVSFGREKGYRNVPVNGERRMFSQVCP